MNSFVIPNNGSALTEREFQERPTAKVDSRGNTIDRATVMKNVGGQQAWMVHVAARMTRRMLADRRKTEIDPYVTPVDALLEIEKGPVNIEEYIMIPPSKEWVERWYASRANNVTWNL